MRRIVYLTFYFRPDLCAGSFRNSPLALELASQAKMIDCSIDIYTTLPNRYSSFSADALEFEAFENVRINRIKLPLHNSGMVDQILSFWTYYSKVIQLNKRKEAEIIFASSSRLFTAFLGYKLSRRLSAKLILDIRDIFVDTISDVVKFKSIKFFLLPFLTFVERRTFNKALHINLISRGFEEYFKKFNCQNYSFYSNGIDDEFLRQNIMKTSKKDTSGIKKIVYAGNIGQGQGLHKIIPQSALELGENFEFIIIGDGGARHDLEMKIKKFGVSNVTLLPPLDRKQLINFYLGADYLFIHLNDYEAFKKVLPSKIFELGTMNKFILAGVSGYAADFMEKEVSNIFLFKPCDVSALVDFLKNHRNMNQIDRASFIQKYKRDNINKDFATTILSYL